MKRILCLIAAIWTGTAWAAVPNGSFEEGNDAPKGWTAVGAGCAWVDGGTEGKKAAAVSGEGETHTFWRSDPVTLAAGKAYRFRFKAKGQGLSGGTPISGPPFANRDLGAVPGDWTEYESIFVVPSILRPEEQHIRLGQWHVRGAILYDAAELREAIPVHAREGDLVLGEGERIDGHAYMFDAPFRSIARNHARPLAGYSGAFNTDRWAMSRGSEVTYRHEIGARRQTAAEVRVGVTYYQGGRLIVEASADGNTYLPLGSIEKIAEQAFKIPPQLLPAKAVWVRFRPEPASVAGRGGPALQVGSYAYSATVDGPPAKALGSTRFLAIGQTDERLDVTILDLGEALPGGRNILVADVTNKTGQAVEVLSRVGDEGKPMALAPGKNTLRLPYQLPGPGIHSLPVSVGGFRAEARLRIAELHDSSYGERLSDTPEGALWWCSSGWKVSQSRPAPSAEGAAIRIAAARNEAEAAQLVVRPERPLKGLRATVTDLRGPEGATIPAASIELLRVRYVQVTMPTDATGCTGAWPDPLPPIGAAGIEVEPGRNQPLWVRVKTPRDAKAGIYRGSIHLAAEGWSADAPLLVEVYNFALPDRMTCTTTFGFSPSAVFRYQKLDQDADRKAVIEKYLRNFSEHHIAPYDPAPLHPIKVTWGDKNNPMPVLDFSRWDSAMSRAIDEYHFNSFVVKVPGMGGGTFHHRVDPELMGFKEETPQYQAAFASYCRQLEDHLRQKGWLDEAYCYWFDEPDPKDYAFVMNGFRKLKEAAPGLNRMLTEQVEPGLAGGPNIWCPISDEYNHDKAEERRKQGEKFWWYVCTGPKAPYATLFIDHPATEMRVWLWQTWQRKIDGILVWGTNYWTSPTAYPDKDRSQNPYDDPMGWQSGYGAAIGARRPWGNGDGRFIYPPEPAASANAPGPVLDGPVDSIRWEMLRDGVEDYEYLTILRKLVEEQHDRLSEADRAESARLLTVPPEITADITTFTKRPEPIERRRDEVARLIARLSR